MRFPFLAAAAFAVGLVVMPAARADAPKPPLTPEQSAAVEQMIHDYLMNHPEVLTQAISHAEDDAKAKDQVAATKLVQAHRDELEHDPGAPIFGDPAGDVTVVEFFDYRCPYCKATAPAVEQLLANDPKIRWVLKDYPILGPDSVYAAQVAAVAQRHGKLREFWKAMFAMKDKATPDSTLKVAKSVGLDPTLVKQEMADPEIDAWIKRNEDLARLLSIDGTPTFIIGTTIFPGAVEPDELAAAIAAARKNPA